MHGQGVGQGQPRRLLAQCQEPVDVRHDEFRVEPVGAVAFDADDVAE